MATLLRIDSSARQQTSVSKNLADQAENSWLKKHPNGIIERLDTNSAQIPHITETVINAMYTPSDKRSADQQHALALSDQLIEQLKRADTLLISTPMYNFSIPSSLKAYLDLVLRVGETFVYTDQGPKGLLPNKEAIIVVATGGNYTRAPLNEMDFVTPYLKVAMNFIGIEQISTFVAPGQGGAAEKAQAAQQQALSEIITAMESDL
ncbi:FMN-dependent NADH-azoreductase [Hydrogenovibrio sp. SC-1]|uniref:FMN-dependent NADH-azoreductase n=1 Tax=Hydrogenovibrio sp. SC-1 TaxID=2065820 RepID=UPI000C7BDCC4|nr:NAD(P)H-dependent oxidoreductase [Hydrogenovibrio sp. SC-1]PLA74503.1 FMN-dependent NADH-azoreductase [Hydrogenovibrio sp. SC-1]